jgi:uncharacterized protein (TIGR03083 family)
MATTTRSEAEALLAAIGDVPPDAPTACADWRAHDLVAHLAAGAREIAELVERKLDGRPGRPTRGFEEREAPFRALDHDRLVDRLVAEGVRKLAAYEALAAHDDPWLEFTGARLSAAQLAVHSRSEAALHRWDLVGDDDTSRRLLGQPDLAVHAARVLTAMPALAESGPALAARAAGAGRPDLTVVLRTGAPPDVVIALAPGSGGVEVVPGAPPADLALTLPAHHRTLVLWGRRPAALDPVVDGDPGLLGVLDHVLWPRARRWG